MIPFYRSASAVLFCLALCNRCSGAAECNGWGDFRGIRVDGQLIAFASSLRMATPGWKEFAFTATQMVRNQRWLRDGDTQTASGDIRFKDGRPLAFKEIVQDIAPDTAQVTITATAQADLDLDGVYYFLNLPARTFGAQPLGVAATRRARITGDGQWIELGFDHPVEVTIRKDRYIDTDIIVQPGLRLPKDRASDDLIAVYFPIGKGPLKMGRSVSATFTIQAGAVIDRGDIHLALDTANPGPPFDGIGGNFRVQGPFDQPSIQYNLDHFRVPWARVAMPLDAWMPREDGDPDSPPPPATQPAAGRGGFARASMMRQMAMAAELARRNIPIIITVWSVPPWALLPPGPQPPEWIGRIPARRVRPDKWDQVDRAIIGYLNYLKAHYNAEPRLFSLNECDLGINVLTTPQEHAQLMARLGAKLAAAGLKTRMLLADACSPHPVKFIDASLADPQAVKYIGGVSYHSWHDGTREEFRAWGAAARRLNVPLFIGEGGTDSDAHMYPQIFHEPWFVIREIETYVQICADSQPLSILHWQLTANYSILDGGGRTGQPLRPSRRYWQLAQLNLTPAGSAALPITADSATVSACAYRHDADVIIHLVNNGPARTAEIAGLPAGLTQWRVFVTDAHHSMQEMAQVPVAGSATSLNIDAQSLTTLTSVR